MEVSAYRILPKEGARDLLRLNLGCGVSHLGGFVNIDSDPGVKPNLIRDLARGLPYSDGTVAEIRCQDVLEHLRTWEDLIFVMNECHRVLAETGTLTVQVPNVLSKVKPGWAFGDPTHTRFFCPHTFNYFQHDHEQYLHNGQHMGALPWQTSILMLYGDGVIRATMQPVKGAQP